MKDRPIRRISTNFEVSVEDMVIALAHPSGTVYLTGTQMQDVLTNLSIVAKSFAASQRWVWVCPGSSTFGVELGSESRAADFEADRIPVRLRSGAHVWFTCEAWELSALISGLVALQAELDEEFEENLKAHEEDLKKSFTVWNEELKKHFTAKAIFGGIIKSNGL
jgi:hypothetical protein